MGFVLYKLEITLENCHEDVRRTIIVPHDVRLDALHVIIQKVMGWRNIHSHYFCAKKIIYAKINTGDMNFRYERQYTLCQIVNARSKSFTYCYDIGEEWVHKVKVLDFACENSSGRRLFSCIDGTGSCPPEDVGGEIEYKCFCVSINDPESADYEHNRKWVFEDCLYPKSMTWPDSFDLENANKQLGEYDSWYKKLVRQRKKHESQW